MSIDRGNGVVKITSSNGQPLTFRSGGEVVQLRVQGGLVGETVLVVDAFKLKNGIGEVVTSAVTGGRARVE